MNTLQFKEFLADEIESHIGPIREKYLKLKSNPERLKEIIEYGNEEARKIAKKNLEEVKTIIGFKN